MERSIADIAEVGDADFAGVVAVASEVAQEGEEGDALTERGIFLGVFVEGDEVEDFFLLFGGKVEEKFAEAVGAEMVEPEEAAAELELVFGIFGGEEVDEFGSASFDGAAGFLVFGDDQIAEGYEQHVLRRGKIFGRVVPCR